MTSRWHGRALQGRCFQAVTDDEPWRHRQVILETRRALDRTLRAKISVGEGDRMSSLNIERSCSGTLMWFRTGDGFTTLLIPALAPYPSNRSHG